MKLERNAGKYKKHPEKVLQFGEGNFLRCFVDWQLDILNETNGLDAGVVVIRPINTDFPPLLNTQDGLYTSILRGYDDKGNLRNDRRVISCVNREIPIYKEYSEFLSVAHNADLEFIVSNTTEAGITYREEDQYSDEPPVSFPAKLTRFLHERFTAFKGSKDSGLTLIPCELIDYNGEKLKEIVLKYITLWNLDDTFKNWILESNAFCSTLVDRIVTGYPREEIKTLQKELGYEDNFITTGEFFHLFVIQGPESLEKNLKLPQKDLNIKVVKDLKPYKLRKVGILNGSHTALVPVAYLQNVDFVKDAVNNPDIAAFIEQLLKNEIMPNLALPEEELTEYAASVVGRFKNPFINHKLLDISLNSMTKFKTRLLPQMITHYERTNAVPELISLAFAALICFYRGEYKGKTHAVKDDQFFMEMLGDMWKKPPQNENEAIEMIKPLIELESHWEYPLHKMAGLKEKLAKDIYAISSGDMADVMKGYLK